MKSIKRLIGFVLLIGIAVILITRPGENRKPTTTATAAPITVAPTEPANVVKASNDKRLADVTFEDVERMSREIMTQGFLGFSDTLRVVWLRLGV